MDRLLVYLVTCKQAVAFHQLIQELDIQLTFA